MRRNLGQRFTPSQGVGNVHADDARSGPSQPPAETSRALVRHNCAVPGTGPTLEGIPASASPDEAAAIVAALEHFMRATAPPASAMGAPALDAWHASAILEGVARDPWAATSDPGLGSAWINT
jgi:hypothetical protein